MYTLLKIFVTLGVSGWIRGGKNLKNKNKVYWNQIKRNYDGSNNFTCMYALRSIFGGAFKETWAYKLGGLRRVVKMKNMRNGRTDLNQRATDNLCSGRTNI